VIFQQIQIFVSVICDLSYTGTISDHFETRFIFTHGKKGFVTLAKSFVKIRITKTFCYSNKMFSTVNKKFGCWSKIFGCSDKKLFVVPNIVAVKKNNIFLRCERSSFVVNVGFKLKWKEEKWKKTTLFVGEGRRKKKGYQKGYWHNRYTKLEVSWKWTCFGYE